MTSDELNTIVAAVIQALKTNSKTISQLTPVSSLSDDDSIEIGGGKRVTYAVLKSLIAVLYNAAISNGIGANNEIYFSGSKLKMSAVPDELNAALNEYFEACVRQDSDHLVDLLYSRIVLLDSMGSELDGLTYTPVAGDLVWRNGYVFKWDGTAWEDGAVQPRKHVLYINKHTGKRYMWTGTAMQELLGTSSVHVVNNLTTGGEGDALSAEMGKVLKIAVQTLIDSMGEYCFPNGRPTLSWEGPKCNVTQNLTDVGSNFSPSKIDKNGELEITLTPVDDLHVFLTGDVTVTMGGTDITSTAWNESTGKVTIGEVTDDVVITAKSSTYVQSGLAFQLDGLNRGGTAGHWVDRIGNIDFTLAGHTEATDHVQFSGSASGGEAPTSAALDVDELTSTVEVGYEFTDNLAVGSFFNVLRNKTEGKASACFMNSTVGNSVYGIQSTSNDGSNPACFINNVCANSSTAYKKGFISMRTKSYTYGQTMAAEDGGYFNGQRMNQSTAGASTGLADRLMLMKNEARNTAGKLYSIRVYSRRLTDDEILHNYAIDQKRFNIL